MWQKATQYVHKGDLKIALNVLGYMKEDGGYFKSGKRR